MITLAGGRDRRHERAGRFFVLLLHSRSSRCRGMVARGTHLVLQDSTSAMHRVSPSDIPQLDMSRYVRYGHAASRDGAVLTFHASHRGLGGTPPTRFPFMSRYSSVVLKQSSALESCAAPLSVILFRARLRERRTTLASSASAISLAPPSSMLQPLRSSSVRVALTARALQSLPMFFGLHTHTRVSDGNRHERKVTEMLLALRGGSQLRDWKLEFL